LKNDTRTANIPVIVVSIVDHAAMGAAIGADEYLVKPVDRKTLLGAVERCIARRESSAPVGPILVVEDDVATREMIVELLSAKGYPVKSAVDGVAARAQVAASLPELVILDLMLPKVSGFELLAEWRGNSRTTGIPVFVLTSKDLSKEEKNYLREHTQSLFHKQESWQEGLVKQIQRAVGKPQVAKT
jgi:DNA-binding response OmpR family regulator